MTNSKGSASIEMVLFITMLIVFMILPMLSMGIEKIIVYTCIDRSVEAMEIALFDLVESVSLESLSMGEVYFETSELEYFFHKRLDEKLSPIVRINLSKLEFMPYEKGLLPCSFKKQMTYDTLHVELEILYTHFLYRKVLEADKNNVVQFHFDLEIPMNN